MIFALLTSVFVFGISWNHLNDIRELRDSGTVQYKFSELPNYGHTKRPVWTSYHYPYKTGGTKEALKKLEQVSELSVGAYDWEVRFNERNAQYGWGGHCNGLAVAGIVESEPQNDVRYAGVNFSTDNIKALLMEVYQGPMPVVGDRCSKEEFATDASGRVIDRECQDINAGTFHLVLGNYLGLRGDAIIVDVVPRSVVWNWPAYEYSSEIQKISLPTVLSLLNISDRSYYPYNSTAVEFYKVRTLLKTKQDQDRTYDYIVEVDGSGNVVGGEWIGESRLEHPDFIWRPDGFSLENPYVDIWTILDIASRSY